MSRNQKITVWILILFTLSFTGVVTAAEYLPASESYTLEAGNTVSEDLYVIAEDVIIEGTLDGDLFAFANFVHVEGTVTGDVLVIADGFRLDGEIQDDARVLTLSSMFHGTVNGDVMTVDYGLPVTSAFFQSTPRSFTGGTFFEGVQIGGDLIVIYSSLLSMIDSQIDGSLSGTIFRLDLENSNINGGTDIGQLSAINIDTDSRVTGADGFQYSASGPLDVPSTLSENIQFEQLETEGINWPVRLRQIFGRIAGYAVLGWVLLQYRSHWLSRPADGIRSAPSTAAWYGFTFAFFFLPLISLPIMFISGFFWGPLSSFAIGGFVFFGMVTIWLLSPIFVGYWLSPWFSRQPFQGLIIGSSIISIMLEIPLINFVTSMLVISLTVGGVWLAIRPYLNLSTEE